MSRAYRVKVRESLRTTVRGEDHVGACLELLEVLPAEEMAALLAEELKGRGFAERNGRLARQGADGLTVLVDPCDGSVEVRSVLEEELSIEGERSGVADEDWGEPGRIRAERKLRGELIEELDKKAGKGSAEAQKKATDRLEAGLLDVRAELDKVVNRVTAEALKRKAGRLGRIKAITEDAEAGSLTIVLEV